MNKSYKKLSAWMILVGLFLQISTPLVAAMQSSNSIASEIVMSGRSGDSISVGSLELNQLEIEKPESVNIANFNLEGLIEHIVEDAVQQGCEDALSSALKQCYKLVSEGQTIIDIKMLIEAMPEILQYAIEHEKMRAARPSLANNTLVSCSGSCDLTQVIQLLSSIRTHIGTVEDNPCCNSILGILGDACNVPCIGENGSISEVLCEILNTVTVIDIPGVFTVLADIKDTLTECCAQIQVEFNGVFTVLADIKTDIFDTQTLIIDDFQGTWTILADIKDTLTECCAQIQVEFNGVFTVLADIKTDIFDTQTLIIEGFEGTWTMIEDCCACGPIPLFQSDVVGGVINLTTTGLNYCLAENITGNIFISGGNVTVDGSDRVLSGRVYVNAADVIFKNTKVKPVAPGDSTEAGFAGIHATLSSTKLQVLNCLVECEDTVLIFNPAINGRTGIFSDADKTVIKDCKVIAGGGGGDISGNGGNGGNGIEINGNDGLIDNSIVAAGNGGNGGGFGPGNGGNGGFGIRMNGVNGLIHNSIVAAGIGAFGSIDGGDGGNGIEINGAHGLIDDSTVTAGTGGFGNTGIGGDGGNGIEINDVYGLIHNLKVTAGAGGGGVITGGDGGNGIVTQANDVIVVDSQLFAGDGGNSVTNGGNAGFGVAIRSNNITINNVIITAGNGGNGDSGFGANGGDSINIVADGSDIKTVIITACTIVDGGVGGSSISGTPGNGGRGIFIGSSFDFVVSDVQISDCTINNVGQATEPGIGGDGIRIDSADTDNSSTCIQVINTKIIGCGGNGFYVVIGSNIEVKECSASCNGIDGFAVDNGGGIIFDSLNSLHNTGTGIRTGGDSFDVQIKDCKAEANGADGISIGSAITQVISCCSTSNGLFGINNLGGTTATYYNNVATDNLGGNYSGVSLVRVPGPQTGFYTNVAQGPQDCDLCDLLILTTLVLEIIDTQTLIIADIEGTWTMIEDCCACGPIPLFQSDVVGGQILLSTPGKNYCLAENITGNIVITGGNVTVEGNDRVLVGSVRLDAADIIVKNLKVEPIAPTDNTEAAFSAIDITSNGANAQILNCLIVCAQSVSFVAFVNGRSGISSAATKTSIKNCNITAGSANIISLAGVGATGGDGIILNGSFGLISDSLAVAGAGSATSGGGSNGGNGGVGARVIGSDVQIINSEFTGGNGGIGQLSGGFAGSGVSLSGFNAEFLNSDATGGNGGSSTLAGAAASGLLIVASKVAVRNSVLTGGVGGVGIASAGAGGNGVSVSADDVEIVDSRAIAGDGASSTGGNGGAAGSGVFAQDSNRIGFINLIASGGNGGNASGTGIGGVGGSSINLLRCASALIKGCDSLDRNNGGSADQGTGGAGGTSINLVTCTFVIVKECNVLDGNNGGPSALGTGGAGGFGIATLNSSDVQISECRVERVGVAGNGAVDGVGILIGGTGIQVTNNYVLGCPGSGIQIGGNAQVVSNRVSACDGTGILNLIGTQATFYNNIVTDCSPNYVNVPLIRVPGPQTGFFTNVTQGSQDCDFCDIATIIIADIFYTQTLIKQEIFNTQTLIKQEIFNTQTLIIDDFHQTWTMIEDCCACGPIPLFQSDVVSGVINLSIAGMNYCLAENITGNISISGSNVTVDGNDREVTGRILISGNDVIIKNTKVKPLFPADSIDATNAAINITGVGVSVLNCLIECANSIFNSVNGRDGIRSTGSRTVIQNCIIKAGNGAPGNDSSTGFPGGNGGSGIKLEGNEIGLIEDTRIIGGDGGDGGSGSGVSGAGGAGGAGGDGILIELNSSQIVVRNVIITDFNGGNGGNGSVQIGTQPAGLSGIGGNGGNGIRVNNTINLIIDGCSIQNCGFSGNAGTGLAPLLAFGGHGIFIEEGVTPAQILNCKIENVGRTENNSLVGGDGIRVQSAFDGDTSLTGNIQIFDNKLVSIGGVGIHLTYDLTLIGPNNCQVISNIIDTVGLYGIYVEVNALNIQVVSNRVNSASGTGIVNDCVTAVYTNNQVSNSTISYGGLSPIINTVAYSTDPGYWSNVF